MKLPTLTQLSKVLRKVKPSRRTVKALGVGGLFAFGSRLWFEYHCWESPESADAELWYHTHQEITVLGFAKCDQPCARSFKERVEAGGQLLYKVRFDDGLEYDVFEEELMSNVKGFCRPNPPKRRVVR